LNDFFTEDVFVADVGRHLLARDGQRPLPDGATIKVAQWNLHHVDEPAKARRNEFAERHQVDLVVAQRQGGSGNGFRRGVAGKGNDAVGVAVVTAGALMQGHAHQQRGAAFACHGQPVFPHPG